MPVECLSLVKHRVDWHSRIVCKLCVCAIGVYWSEISLTSLCFTNLSSLLFFYRAERPALHLGHPSILPHDHFCCMGITAWWGLWLASLCDPLNFLLVEIARCGTFCSSSCTIGKFVCAVKLIQKFCFFVSSHKTPEKMKQWGRWKFLNRLANCSSQSNLTQVRLWEA